MPIRTASLHAELARRFGYPGFRPGQEELVRAVLDGRDALGILPTGGGKSVCYMLPACLLPGLTVVVSPLISLMSDQVERAEQVGIPAGRVNSTQLETERRDTLARAARGELKLLLLAPERLAVPAFRALLERLAVSLLAVDEAHSITEWGHDFRPSYLALGGLRPPLRCPVMAVTATATPHARLEIERVMRLKDPVRVVGGFDRPNLDFAVERVTDGGARVAGVLRRVRGSLRADAGSVVVYAGTRRTVESLRARIARTGVRCAAYHGGMPAEERAEVQADFMASRVRVVTATNAFGMGVDKADVRLVVHWQLPGTLEAYYQEAGRAGRDGRAARCVAYLRDGDFALHRAFIERGRPRPSTLRRVLASIRRQLGAERSGWVDLVQIAKGLGRGHTLDQVESAIRALQVGGALRVPEPVRDARCPMGTLDSPAGSPRMLIDARGGALDLRRAKALRRAAQNKLAAVERYATASTCRRRQILEYFGEGPRWRVCGRCDRCRERLG